MWRENLSYVTRYPIALKFGRISFEHRWDKWRKGGDRQFNLDYCADFQKLERVPLSRNLSYFASFLLSPREALESGGTRMQTRFRGQRPLAISWDWVTCKSRRHISILSSNRQLDQAFLLLSSRSREFFQPRHLTLTQPTSRANYFDINISEYISRLRI